ncbi:MAG: hypothetical protein DSM106950_20280 [Stigonema ocellatum SAG 48.90 = DSM 106950]|nr:hypothetical protein [Stigonema ocellatum SAG 48.90 = DSM 106950]
MNRKSDLYRSLRCMYQPIKAVKKQVQHGFDAPPWIFGSTFIVEAQKPMTAASESWKNSEFQQSLTRVLS